MLQYYPSMTPNTLIRSLLVLSLTLLLSACFGKKQDEQAAGNATGYGGGDPEFQVLAEVQTVLRIGLSHLQRGEQAGLLCEIPEGLCPAGVDAVVCDAIRRMTPSQVQSCQRMLSEAPMQEFLNREPRSLYVFVESGEELLSDDGLAHHARTPLGPEGSIEISRRWFVSASRSILAATLAHEILHKVLLPGSNQYPTDSGPVGAFSSGRQMLDILGYALTAYSALYQKGLRCAPGTRKLSNLPLCVAENADIELYDQNGSLVLSYELDLLKQFQSGAQRLWLGVHEGSALIWEENANGKRNPTPICSAELLDNGGNLVEDFSFLEAAASPLDQVQAIHSLQPSGELMEWNASNCANLGTLRRQANLRSNTGAVVAGTDLSFFGIRATAIIAVGGNPEQYYQWGVDANDYPLQSQTDPLYDSLHLPIVQGDYKELSGTHLGTDVNGVLSNVDSRFLVWDDGENENPRCDNRLLLGANQEVGMSDFSHAMISNLQGSDAASLITITPEGRVNIWHISSCATKRLPDIMNRPLLGNGGAIVPGSSLEVFREGNGGSEAGYYVGEDTHLADGSERPAGTKIRYIWEFNAGVSWRLVALENF